MASNLMNAFDQTVRWHVYQHFVEHTVPPTVAELATRLNVSADEMQAAYRRLDQSHAFFLQPGTLDIRMANPFSAVPTSFRVHTNNRAYWANCAWDAFGIPAMLGSDAQIEALCADCQEPLQLQVINGQVVGNNEVVHFALPFRLWYNDLIET